MLVDKDATLQGGDKSHGGMQKGRFATAVAAQQDHQARTRQLTTKRPIE